MKVMNKMIILVIMNIIMNKLNKKWKWSNMIWNIEND